jgi:hypothetical protein
LPITVYSVAWARPAAAASTTGHQPPVRPIAVPAAPTATPISV